MVFQNYALYPHMAVYDNLAFSPSDNKLFVQADGFRLIVPEEKARNLQEYVNKRIILGIRPQDLSKAPASIEGETIEAFVEIIEPIGNEIY